MKQVLQNYRTGELKVHDVPPPSVAPGFVVVATRSSLISAGTERSTVTMANKSLAGKAMARPDLVSKVLDKVKKEGVVDTLKMVNGRLDSLAALGYSSAGIVIAVGEGVEDFRVGDHVACAGQNFASHAEVVQIPKNLCTHIPSGVAFDDAAYVAVGSIALQGLRQADPKLGETVAVIGLGLLGLILVQMLRANGCRVIATDLDEVKLELAKSFGIESAVTPDRFLQVCGDLTSNLGVDSVIITASTKSDLPVSDSAEACRKKGKVVVVGAVGMNLPREPYYMKELELKLSTSYGPGRYDSDYEEGGVDYPYAYVRWTEKRNMQAFLSMLASRQIELNRITTHKYPIDDAETAYEMIARNSERYMGIVLQYDNANAERSLDKRIDLRTLPSGKDCLGVSVVGPGSHVRDMLLPHLKSANGFQLQGVNSAGGVSAKQVADRFEAAYTASSIDQVLEDSDTDIVLIGTRHDTHAQYVLSSLQAGKHVFVEKPLAINEDELSKIEQFFLAGTEKVKPVLTVGFNRRYSVHAKKIREHFLNRGNPLTFNYRVNAGAIPPDHWIQDMKEGGGRIIGEGCHFIDLMQYIAGALPVDVYARSIAKHSSGITSDNVHISIGFSDGSIGNLMYVSDGDKRLDKEYLEVYGDGKVAIMTDFFKTDFYERGKSKTFKSGKRDKGFAEEIMSLRRQVSGQEGSYLSLDEIFYVTRATFLASESLKIKQPLKIGGE